MRIDKRSFLKYLAAGLGISTCKEPLFAQQATAQTNWAGNLRYGTDRLLNIESLEQLQDFVARQRGLKALGSRHCFSPIADNVHQLISLRSMNRLLEIDETEKTVTVEAGIKYGELGPQLDRAGFALHNLASLPHITVAGAIATATHGSGSTNGNLATAVTEIQFVSADGQLRKLSRARHGDEFPGAVVHLGALGIVTQVKLNIQPTFRISEYSYRGLSMANLCENFPEIMNHAYSVSVFTNWDSASVRLKVREASGFEAKPELFGARLATNDKSMEPGPWWLRLPHFTMDRLADRGNELQSEYFVPLRHAAAAIQAVSKLGDRIRPVLRASELRTVAADRLWMSPCYGQASLAIHFTWKPDNQAVADLLPEIEKRLEPFRPRPHWGKLFVTSKPTLSTRYERLNDFRKLATKYDPEGKFQNAFLQQHLF